MKKNYRLIKSADIEELHGSACVYEHEGTGARVLTVKNSDKNKVFMIGFRTPPADSTGVAHIMEHSVLCGSQKYPIKDPFVELAKGSLNTFLNAMTYPDKTVYPVASVNDRDFMNLMDVYLDSVFHPNVYKDPRIFRQEGWHYEIENPGAENEEIKLNGVVYNEMKGAFSNPDSVLERYTLRALFPDTPYAVESGGDPDSIPELTSEAFLDFHKKYYHPSNSYIYLYGDMDMEEKLAWLDENYLKEFTRISVDSHIPDQEPPAAPVTAEQFYAVSENEGEEGRAYLSENYCLPDAVTQEYQLAWNILDYVLISSPGAVLKEALVNAGIGDDITGGLCTELNQPYFSVIAKNTDASKTGSFKKVIRDTLVSLCEKGINKKSLTAAINYFEFKLREEDYGSYPAGLIAGLNIMGSWLYDRDPFEYVRYNDALKSIKEASKTGYFEELIRKGILNNSFSAVVNIIPKTGLTKQKDDELRERLEAYRASLSSAEKEELKEKMDALKKYQSEPDTPEALSVLPVLKVSDIEKKAEHYNTKLDDGVIWTDADAAGIAYIRVMFDTEGLTEDEVQVAAFLKDALGEMDTTKHGYQDLFDEIMLATGGISLAMAPAVCRDEPGGESYYRGFLNASIRAMQDKIPESLNLLLEMLNDTVLDNPERIMQLLNQSKSQQRLALESAMHRAAATRAGSYLSDAHRFSDLTGGIACYDFLDAAVKLTAEPLHMKRFIKSLKAVRDRIFTADRVSFALYGSPEALKSLKACIPLFTASLAPSGKNGAPAIEGRPIKSISCLNEGFKTSSQVNYTARCGTLKGSGIKYTGALQVLRTMLNYDYLWVNIRVLGGAYGCSASFSRSGHMYMASYRDPNIKNTNDIYEGLPDYLENWEGGESAVSKFIIGTMSSVDMPLTHAVKAAARISDYLYKYTYEERQQERDAILGCTAKDIRDLAPCIRRLLGSTAICTIGNAGKVEESGSLYKAVRELF